MFLRMADSKIRREHSESTRARTWKWALRRNILVVLHANQGNRRHHVHSCDGKQSNQDARGHVPLGVDGFPGNATHGIEAQVPEKGRDGPAQHARDAELGRHEGDDIGTVKQEETADDHEGHQGDFEPREDVRDDLGFFDAAHDESGRDHGNQARGRIDVVAGIEQVQDGVPGAQLHSQPFHDFVPPRSVTECFEKSTNA